MAAKKDQANVEETKAQEQKVEEAAAEQREPSEFYEVRVNPKLALTDAVSLPGGITVYADHEKNRRLGSWVLDDVQLEGVKNLKDPATGLNYLKTKKIDSADSDSEE